MPIDWVDDSENDTVDPNDGEEPIVFWWDDMHPREVMALVKEVYERAVRNCPGARQGRYRALESTKRR